MVTVAVRSLGYLLLFASSLAYSQTGATVAARATFIPQGFDDNDEIVVVLEGVLPNTCHKLTQPEVRIDETALRIEITPKAYISEGRCINVPVPFEQEVALGALAAGAWTVVTKGDPNPQQLGVSKAVSPESDEYLYAPVDSVTVEYNQETGGLVASLSGDILSSCLKFDELRLLDQGPVLVLLPILSQIPGECRSTSEHFHEHVALPQGMVPGRHLLHVRSLNGRALNRLFDVIKS